jgi:hypothetical protein
MRKVLRLDGHGPKMAQRAIRIDDLMFRIGKQAEGQSFLGAELLVAIGSVHAHAEYNGVLSVIHGLIALEVVGFDGAAGGHVFGVEVEHHPFAAKSIQRNLRAILRWKSESGRILADSWHGLIRGVYFEECNREYKNSGQSEEEQLLHVKPPGVKWRTGNWGKRRGWSPCDLWYTYPR